jgi:hypothetical protein
MANVIRFEGVQSSLFPYAAVIIAAYCTEYAVMEAA